MVTTMRFFLKIFLFLILISSQAWAGTGTRTTFNPFTGKLDYIGAEDIKTDCSAVTQDGQFCWDSDNNILYVGTGSGVSAIGGSSGLTIGTTTITSGTDTRVLFDDGGVVGEDSGFTYNKTTDALTLAGAITASGKITGNASLDIKNGATSSGVLAIFEDSDAGTNKATFQVPSLTSDTVYTLPADDGDADQVLSTNGSGTLDWVAAGSGGTPGGSSGELQWNSSSSFDGVEGSVVGATGTLSLVPTASTSGSPNLFAVTGPAHTTLTASTEASDVNLALARTVQFSTGALAAQRAVKITAPTYAFAGASTITRASTVAIVGAPIAGTNATITNSHMLSLIATSDTDATSGLYIRAGTTGGGTAYGIYIDGPGGTHTFAVNHQNATFFGALNTNVDINSNGIGMADGKVINFGGGYGYLGTVSNIPTFQTFNELRFTPGSLGGSGTRRVSIISQNATDIPFAVKGAASQSGNLTEWQNSTGTALSGVSATGKILVINGSASATSIGQGDGAGAETGIYWPGAGYIAHAYAGAAVFGMDAGGGGGLTLYNGKLLRFDSSTGSGDVGISRSSAGLLQINTGTAGTYADLIASQATLTQVVKTTGSPTALTVTGGAHTTLTASTEATDVNLNLARTVQFATGALTTQRAVRIQAPTYGFVGASTITNAATLAISGAPVAGTNATLTNTYALWVQGGITRLDGAVSGVTTLDTTGDITVTKNGDANIKAVSTSSEGYATFMLTNDDRSYSMQIRADESDAWCVRDETGGANRLQISTAGAWRGPAYGAGTATFDSSGNITSVSDERLKIIQGSYTAGLKEILQISPILYKWNDKSGMETEHTYAGFSAQNVEKSIPYGTGQNAAGYLSLQDRAILAALVNAVKDQQKEIEKIKGKIK